jgi:hypothetical protein
LVLEEPLLAPPAPFKVFRAVAFLGGSAWVVVDVLEEDSDGSTKFSYPMYWLKDGSSETVSAIVDKRPATTALCDTLNLGEELRSITMDPPWHAQGTTVLCLPCRAVDETNHGSYVGVCIYRSTPYKGKFKKVNAGGTYEVTPLTGDDS